MRYQARKKQSESVSAYLQVKKPICEGYMLYNSTISPSGKAKSMDSENQSLLELGRARWKNEAGHRGF